ncbi:hypothetical protein ACFSTC_06665 [Nonomuraea ferruginea]
MRFGRHHDPGSGRGRRQGRHRPPARRLRLLELLHQVRPRDGGRARCRADARPRTRRTTWPSWSTTCRR